MEIMEIIKEIGVVIGIVLLSYIVGMGLKAWDKFDDRKIPVLMAVSGAVLGVITYFVEPTLLGQTGGIISAIVKGAASGLAATGINQIIKQSKKES